MTAARQALVDAIGPTPATLPGHRVARDGIVVFERDGGTFQQFWLDAVGTWCDLAPVLEPIYARALESVRR